VTDPVLIALVAACARGLVRMAAALTQWLVLRAWTDLVRTATIASHDMEITERSPRECSRSLRITVTVRSDR
jgi:hypothetical protein